jgi:hypothetical protein
MKQHSGAGPGVGGQGAEGEIGDTMLEKVGETLFQKVGPGRNVTTVTLRNKQSRQSGFRIGCAGPRRPELEIEKERSAVIGHAQGANEENEARAIADKAR